MSMTRREFLMGTSLGAAMALSGERYAHSVEPEWVEVTRRALTIPGWPPTFDGLRVAHLTDLHHSPMVSLEYLEGCVTTVKRERPDLVVLTGDYVTQGRRKEFIEPVAAAVGNLAAPLGVFASLGNHDVWAGAPAVCEALARHGVAVLRNQHADLSRRGGGLSVVGLGDLWTEGVDLAGAFREVPADRASLILMHNPDTFEEWPAGRPGLILAGHTHGGQVVIPGYGPPFVPSRYGRKYARGLFERADATMYVNRGLGTTVVHVRFLARPEIALLTIHSA